MENLITKEDIEELKKIHLQQTGEKISDQETLEMGTRLVMLMRALNK